MRTHDIIEPNDLFAADLDITISVTTTEVVGVAVVVTGLDLHLINTDHMGVFNGVIGFRPVETGGHILSTSNFKVTRQSCCHSKHLLSQ